MASKKSKLILLFALGIALFYYFDLGHYLSLQNLKANRDSLRLFNQQNPVVMVVGFVAAYIAVTALSLPGATILTLAGGAIFGPIKATLLVNVGATLGATLAFLVARVLLSEWVERKFGDKLQSFHEGVAKNAINFVLFLRLVPAFPFFLVNLALGLTPIPLRVYFLGTMIGILPGSFVYANAGSNLASINTLSDVATPGVLGAFALLGFFALLPTIYKKIKSK
jgi:uncharacterized membrane protein YdjX (TVP38/TMEM64 family)